MNFEEETGGDVADTFSKPAPPATYSPEQVALEAWWNEDPEMRHVEVLCGDSLRVCVRLFQINMHAASFECGETLVAEFEAGALLEAINGAVERART